MPHPDPLRRDPAPEPGADRDEDARHQAAVKQWSEETEIEVEIIDVATLSDEEREELRLALDDVAAGRTLSHEYVTRHIETLLAQYRSGGE